MNLKPRIDSIAAALEIEYTAACKDELEPFERIANACGRIDAFWAVQKKIEAQHGTEAV